MKTKFIRSISILVLLTFILVGALVAPVYAQENLLPLGEPFKVGVLGVMTGAAASWGLVCKYSTEAYANLINERGGFVLDGERHMIEVYSADDKLDGKIAVQGAERLIYQDGVKYIIGPNESNTTASIQPLVEAEKVIHVGYAEAKTLYTENHPNSFLGYIIAFQTCPIIYSYLKDNNGVKTVSFIARNAPSSLGNRDSGIAAAKQLGLEIISSDIVYEPETSDFFSILTNVLKDPPDLLVLSCVSPSDAPLIIKTARQLGYKGLISTEAGQDIGILKEGAGEYAEGFLYASGGSAPGIRSELMEVFIKEYIKIAGEWNDEAGVKVYALPMIIFTLQEAGTIEAFKDVELFKKAIDSVSIIDPFIVGNEELKWVGKKDFGRNLQIGIPMVITQVKDGKDFPLYIGYISDL